MMRTNTHRGARRGFTLLELAVVIGIISLIAGAGMNMATGALKAADRVTTQERLNTIKLALDSFGKTYGYLPCPAERDDVPSASSFGVALTACTANSPTPLTVEVLAANNIAVGIVPVRTLGLPDSYAADAWGNKMSYGVSIGLTRNPASFVTNNGGNGAAISIRFGTFASNFQHANRRMEDTGADVTNNSGTPLVTVTSTGNLANGYSVNLAGSTYKGSYTVANRTGTTFELSGVTYTVDEPNITATWDEPGAGAAYVVVSHGPDGRGAFPLNAATIPLNKVCYADGTVPGTSSPAPCPNGTQTCIDIENCGTGTTNTNTNAQINATFYDSAYNDGPIPATYFDDYVVWGSNANLRATVNNSIYTKVATPSSCPTGVCESWCAVCELNYPGGSPTLPALGIGVLNHATSPGIKLCKKVITSNAADCKASCFWSGVTSTNNHYKCP